MHAKFGVHVRLGGVGAQLTAFFNNSSVIYTAAPSAKHSVHVAAAVDDCQGA